MMKTQVVAFQEHVIESEEKIFKELDLADRLFRICGTREGLKKFAEAFYFVRYKFYKLNFIVGARSDPDERSWRGIVENLMEELGGSHDGVSHNELYRRFLAEAGGAPEGQLTEPLFAKEFNDGWEHYAYNAPFDELLAAIAVYEILDNPDYQLLLTITQNTGVSGKGLVFWKVHAGAVHFALFEEFANRMFATPGGAAIIEKAAGYVLAVQRKLWVDLLRHLEQ
jgi:hypothetical protein